MTTSFWEKTTDLIIDDPESLRQRIIIKYQRFFVGIPQLVTAIRVSQDWTCHEIKAVEATPIPRIILFRPPPEKGFFGCVRVSTRDHPRHQLWDLFSWELPAQDVYTGFIPSNHICWLQDVEVKLVEVYAGQLP